MDSLGIEGAWVGNPRIHRDHRGEFSEWFQRNEFIQDLGYEFGLAQANCSTSRRGVIRGVHFTDVPPGQAKYITCANGAILDVVLDIRVGSPTYQSWKAVQLDDETRRTLFVSEGLGHAFIALSSQATVMYLCSTPYAPQIERGVNPLDPAVGIRWPQDTGFVLSEKDAAAPTLDEARTGGILPHYRDCIEFAERLRKATPAPHPDQHAHV